jgi:hypothetical protein
MEAHDLSMRTHVAAEMFQRLCQALEPFPRTCYRGISRFPIQPLPSPNPEILRAFTESGCDVDTEYAARRRFLEILGEDIPDTDFDEALLPSFSAAQEIFALLEAPGEYEIVHVRREAFCNDADCLGFDVGYWGGDHYSIVCDSAVRPLWHPPQPDCFDELACALATVNEHFLFRNPEDAAEFRAYYRTQPWAETETWPDEFCIIQLSRPRS